MSDTSTTRRPVACITGGKRGIGKGIAVALAQKGFDIVINDLERDAVAQETLEELQNLGARAVFVQGDISNLEGHAALVEAAFAAYGTVDCWVNNAGVSVAQRGDLLEVTPQGFDRVMDINLRGTFFLTQEVAKRMLLETRTDPLEPARTLVTISSFNALGVSIDRAEYTLSKAGLSMMVKLFAVRLAPHNIGVFEVRPGVIRTDMTAVASAKYDRLIAEGLTPMPRWGKVEDVGRAVAVLAGGELGFCVGEVIHVDGGLSVPRL
jgi:3-oxoacyl-[acyl-carrier protein] reductase